MPKPAVDVLVVIDLADKALFNPSAGDRSSRSCGPEDLARTLEHLPATAPRPKPVLERPRRYNLWPLDGVPLLHC
jgi:hypothetical protein